MSSGTSSSLPPDIFGDGEIITFFPTVEFIKSQAEYLWNSTEPYFVKLSSYKQVKILGSNPYLLNNTSTDLSRNGLAQEFEFGSDDIELVYQESSAAYTVIFPEKIEIKVKKPAILDSMFIAKGTEPLLGGLINYSSNNEVLFIPFKDNVTRINADFFNTTSETYYLGLAKDVDIIQHSVTDLISSQPNFVLFNSTNDFLSKSILNFEDNSSMATYVELNPINFELGTIVSRPSVMINYGTEPITFTGSKTDLVYNSLFIFKSSESDDNENSDKNLMVCYAAPLNQNYYLFGVESSKAMFDDSEKALEITDHQIKTELTWEVVVF